MLNNDVWTFLPIVLCGIVVVLVLCACWSAAPHGSANTDAKARRVPNAINASRISKAQKKVAP